jgi:hypothetical protein
VRRVVLQETAFHSLVDLGMAVVRSQHGTTVQQSAVALVTTLFLYSPQSPAGSGDHRYCCPPWPPPYPHEPRSARRSHILLLVADAFVSVSKSRNLNTSGKARIALRDYRVSDAPESAGETAALLPLL